MIKIIAWILLICAVQLEANASSCIHATQYETPKTRHELDIVKLDTDQDKIVKYIKGNPDHNNISIDQNGNFYLSIYQAGNAAGKKIEFKRGRFPYLTRTVALKGNLPTDIILTRDKLLVLLRSVERGTNDVTGFAVYDRKSLKYLKDINFYRDFYGYEWALSPDQKRLYFFSADERLLLKEQFYHGADFFLKDDFAQEADISLLYDKILKDYPSLDLKEKNPSLARKLDLCNGVVNEVHAFYEMIKSKRQDIVLSQELQKLLSATEQDRKVKYPYLPAKQHFRMRHCNRLLLEALYPELCPKSSAHNFIASNYAYSDTEEFVKVADTSLYEIDLDSMNIITKKCFNSPYLGGGQVKFIEGKLYLAYSSKVEQRQGDTFPKNVTDNLTLQVFDWQNDTYLKPIYLGHRPWLLHHDQAGKRLYVISGDDHLQVLDLANNQIINEAKVQNVRAITMSNNKIYLNCRGIDGGSKADHLTVLNKDTLAVLKTIPGTFGPFALTFE
ncbi:MAG: hypothetical protein WC838_06470 [Candidatus Margulisiibacteriota bacterium]|jgi:hypothetical protein